MKRVGILFLALLLALSLLPGSRGAAAGQAPVGISDAAGLAAIRENMAGSYVLLCDIDLTEALSEGGSLWNEAGWIALGYDPVQSKRVDFTGSLDGNGFRISGLRCEGFGCGLFWTNRGEIRNLSLAGTILSSNPRTSFAAVGSFCCFNAGLIANCSSAVSIDNVGKPNDYTGGIAGLNYQNGLIWDCVNTGALKTGHTFEDNTGVLAIGGIAGCNYGTIRGCQNSGTVLAQADATSENQFSAAWPYVAAGGIVGDHSGLLEQVVNTGSVTASYPFLKSYPAVAAGGLVGRQGTETRHPLRGEACSVRDGYNTAAIHAEGFHAYAGGVIGIYAPYSDSQAIRTCYNIGLADAVAVESQYEPNAAAAGAICGYQRNGAERFLDCYFLDNMEDALGVDGDHTCTGVPEEEMRSQETFVGFDFTQIWDMGTGDYLYPVLERHIHRLTHVEAQEPDCQQDGNIEYWICRGCSRCFADEAMGQELSIEQTVLPGGHIYEASVIAPTCTEDGFTEHVCARCGDVYRDAYVDALGHDWGAPSYDWSPDEAEVTASRLCLRDPAHTESETVQTRIRILTAPTYFEEGSGERFAVFANAAFAEQVRPCTLPKLTLPCDGHVCPGSVFTDMPPKRNWAHDAIDWAYVTGITSGTTAITFSPQKTCTRAQVVTFLWRASGSPAPQSMENPFTDVKANSYYFEAVLWAVESGVTNGTSATTFNPNTVCTRGQVVTFLWRFAGSPEPDSTECPFRDVRPGAFYEKAVLWAVEQHVTTGVTEDTFQPGELCTRAQVVTFLWRAVA